VITLRHVVRVVRSNHTGLAYRLGHLLSELYAPHHLPDVRARACARALAPAPAPALAPASGIWLRWQNLLHACPVLYIIPNEQNYLRAGTWGMLGIKGTTLFMLIRWVLNDRAGLASFPAFGCLGF
jgi:hypothetical protein